MAGASLKIKAICLILLLAGQEAYRIQRAAQASVVLQKSLKPADNRWNQADKQCTWKIHKGGCSGEGCKYRPLPLDTSLTESCRLSDSYMLSSGLGNRRDEFVDMAAQILEEKSTKFKKECSGMKLWQISKQLHCHRRAGRMFRSAQLLSRAVKPNESITDAKQKQIEHALNNIASAFGTDGKYLLEFKDKLKGDFLNIAKDPAGKIKKMIVTVSSLLSGSDREKDQARQSIKKMPSANLTRVSKRDAREIEKVTKQLVQEYDLRDPEVVNEAWSNLDRFIPSQANEEKTSALLQADSIASSQNTNALLILAVAIVLILIILLLVPGWGVGVTILAVVLILILIILLVKFLLGIFRGGNSRGSNRRSSDRRNSDRRDSRRGGNTRRPSRRGFAGFLSGNRRR